MQESDLPIVLEELPNFRLKNVDQSKFTQEKEHTEESRLEIAYEFIKKLEAYITDQQKDKEGLFILYDYEFNHLSRTVFDKGSWPAPEKIEEIKDIEIDFDTQIFYNELCNRHIFARLQGTENLDFKVIAESWDNYINLFETITNLQEEKSLNIPISWIWDIIDEFVYQFQIACRWRITSKEQNKNLQELIKDAKSKQGKSNAQAVYWNLEDVVRILQEVVDKSKVVQSKNGVKQCTTVKNETLNYFGHYALVGLIRLYVINFQYDQAIQNIQVINFNSLTVFSKAVPSYLTLFYYAGITYLMTQQYNKAVNIFQAIVLFFLKYKQFLSKSFQFENMCKQAEKCLVLLILSLVFYPTSLEDTIKQQIQDYTIKLSKNQSKQQQQTQQTETLAEKQKKLESFDSSTFYEVCNYGFVKPFLIIKDSEDFINMGFDNNYDQQALWKHRERLDQEYQEIKYLNDIASILKIYSNVNIIKVAKLLDLGKDQVEKYLDSYKKRNEFNIRQEVPFEDTILRRFLGAGQVQLDFEVQGDQIIVTEVAPERNYVEYFTKLSTQLGTIEQGLSQIGNA